MKNSKDSLKSNSVKQLERELEKASGEEKILIIILLSEKYHDSSPLKVIEYCKQGMELLKDYPDDTGLLTLFHDISWAYQSLGSYQESLEYAFRYYSTTRDAGDRKRESKALNTIGVIYWRLSSFDDAMEYFLKSMDISEELGDTRGIAGSYNNLGILNESLNDIDSAIENYSKALRICREIGEEYDSAGILNNLGVIHIGKGNYEKAEEFCRESLEIRQKLDDIYGVSHTQINLGLIRKELGEYEQALDILEYALNTTIESGDRYAEGEARLHIGLIHESLGDHEKAVEYIKETIRIAGETESGELLEESIMNLSGVHERAMNFKEALELFKQYKETHDNIFDEKSRRRINELEIRFMVKSREREAELIRLKNVDLVKANEDLSNALAQVKHLSGLLPICANCKKIRDDHGYWEQIESYISEHSEVQFSHALCPECMKILYPEYITEKGETEAMI